MNEILICKHCEAKENREDTVEAVYNGDLIVVCQGCYAKILEKENSIYI